MKVLISRYGAYGDIIHCSHLPRLLKDQGATQVDFETNFKGYQLLKYNPFIDNILYFDPPPGYQMHMIQKHWAVLSKGYDRFINLYGSLEDDAIAAEENPIYFMHQSFRMQKYGHVNYYDQQTSWAGFPDLIGCYLGEIFYPQHEIDMVEKWMKQFEGKFVVLLNLCGSSKQKEFIWAKEFTERFTQMHQDAHYIITGGKEYKHMEWEAANVTSIVGKFPFAQALLIAKYVDLVIGHESGIMVGANMWGTPTVQMMTSTNLVAHCKYARNDFSMQSPAYCSPCFKALYRYIGCPKKDEKLLCLHFNKDEVLKNADEAYKLKAKGYERVYS
jgi:ADP-heptose:LPS heptosyltransferase